MWCPEGVCLKKNSKEPHPDTTRCYLSGGLALKGWITPQEALRIDPEFFTRRHDQEWHYDERRDGYYAPFGFSEYRIQVDAQGKPAFGRVCGGEIPNINAVAYFVRDGIWHVGVTFQVRPFADDAYGVPADPPIKFAQPVMGFRERLVGQAAAQVFESAEAGATREALEEAGVVEVRSIKSMGCHWGNPTGPLVTPSDLLEIEVNPDTLTDAVDRTELIFKCEYLPVKELLARVALGIHEGINYRASVAMNTFFVFLTRHPEALS